MCISRREKCGCSLKGVKEGHWGPACSAPRSLVTLWLPRAAAGLSQEEPPGAPSFSSHVKSLSCWLCLPDTRSPPCTCVWRPPYALVIRMDQISATCTYGHAFGDLWTRLLAHFTALLCSHLAQILAGRTPEALLCSAPWGQVS